MQRLCYLCFVLLLVQFSVHAQTPAFFSYQAVACDVDGNELINQKVSIRATILKDGAAGSSVYSEVHSSPSLKTDGFGLFTIQVGNGSIQPSSPNSTLNGIDWKTGNYWLRIEMDPLGGFNFSLVAENRLLSVPYALYAEKARKAEMADFATHSQTSDTAKVAIRAIKADTALYVINSIVSTTSVYSDTSKFTYFAGNSYNSVKSDTALFAFNAQNAVNANHSVKSDTALYAFNAGTAQNALNANHAVKSDTALYAYNAGNALTANFAIKSDTAKYAYNAGNALTANFATKSDTAKYAYNAGNAQNAINANHAVKSDTALYAYNAGNALTANFATKSDTAKYAYNAGNAQTAVNATNAVNAQTAINATNAVNAQTAINATNAVNAQNAMHAVFADSAKVAQMATIATTAVFATTAGTALDDKDKDPTNELQGFMYDSLGNLTLVPMTQGGSTIKLNLVQNFQGPASSHDFPEGIRGKYIVIPNNYTVPVGKHLYLTSGGEFVFLPIYQLNHPNSPTMPIFPEYTSLSNCKCTGLLVDDTGLIDVIMVNFNTQPNFEWTVPSGKVFVLKSGMPINNSRLEVKAPGTSNFVLFEISNSPYEASTRMPTFPAGTTIRKPSIIADLLITGFLFPEF